MLYLELLFSRAPILPVQGHILGHQLTLKAGTAPLFHTYILEGAYKFYRDVEGGQTNDSAFLPRTPLTLPAGRCCCGPLF